MEEIKKMLYQQQRFNVLALFTNTAAQRSVPSSYAYAWAEGVYPFLDEGADWHQPYAELFDLKEPELEKLHKLLLDHWNQKKPITFYELERESGGRHGDLWDRSKLMHACRYFHLHRHFDDAF